MMIKSMGYELYVTRLRQI